MNREDRAEEPQNALRCARRRIPSTQSPGEHLSRQELADAVNAWIYQRTGRTVAVDANYIGKLERGKIRWPNSEYRSAFRAVLNVLTDRALGFTPGSEAAPADGDATVETYPSWASGLMQTTAPWSGSTATLNTGFDETAVLDRASLSAAETVAEFGMWAERLSVGSSVAIEHLHQRTRQLSVAALSKPPRILMTQAVPLAEEVFSLVRRHHRPAHSRDLHVIAAHLCTIMAWLAGDLGMLDVAELQGRTALVCAELADDPQAMAWALVVQSKTAFWRHDFRRAAHLAGQGMHLDPSGTSALMLACQQADALSHLGTVTDTVEAIHRAERIGERLRGSDYIGGLLTCGAARQANYISAAYLVVGQTDLALSEVDLALQTYADDDSYGFGTIAQMHLTRTLAHAQTGRIDAAAEAVRPILDLQPEHRLVTFDAKIDQLAGILQHTSVRSSMTAVRLREELDAYQYPLVGRRQLTRGPSKEKIT